MATNESDPNSADQLSTLTQGVRLLHERRRQPVLRCQARHRRSAAARIQQGVAAC
jgi:hypothetical protein